jgi:hypothetical protein
MSTGGVMARQVLPPGADWTSADPLKGVTDPLPYFRNPYYFRLNQRRFEHLVSLGLPLRGSSVLEVGAGIGDHTEFFLDRECAVTATEGREDNLRLLSKRFRGDARVKIQKLDLDDLPAERAPLHDVVYCYGVLYHLQRPGPALEYLAPAAGRMMLVETVVDPGSGEEENLVAESDRRCSQSLRGEGCRPTRGWVVARLREHFPHVYVPMTQPWHDEFPIDWSAAGALPTIRAVFVAARGPVSNPLLTEGLPLVQRRH